MSAVKGTAVPAGKATIICQSLGALLIGCAITSLPWLTSMTNNDALQTGVSVLLLPGIIVGLLVGHGGMHDASWPATLVASGIFWAGMAYLSLRWYSKRR
jgi:hypothetical protein